MDQLDYLHALLSQFLVQSLRYLNICSCSFVSAFTPYILPMYSINFLAWKDFSPPPLPALLKLIHHFSTLSLSGSCQMYLFIRSSNFPIYIVLYPYFFILLTACSSNVSSSTPQSVRMSSKISTSTTLFLKSTVMMSCTLAMSSVQVPGKVCNLCSSLLFRSLSPYQSSSQPYIMLKQVLQVIVINTTVKYQAAKLRQDLNLLSKVARLMDRLRLFTQSLISHHQDSSSLSQLIQMLGRLFSILHRRRQLYPVTIKRTSYPDLLKRPTQSARWMLELRLLLRFTVGLFDSLVMALVFARVRRVDCLRFWRARKLPLVSSNLPELVYMQKGDSLNIIVIIIL